MPRLGAVFPGPPSAFVFGGEAYGPSTYFSDLWRMDVVAGEQGGLLAAARAHLGSARAAILRALGWVNSPPISVPGTGQGTGDGKITWIKGETESSVHTNGSGLLGKMPAI